MTGKGNFYPRAGGISPFFKLTFPDGQITLFPKPEGKERISEIGKRNSVRQGSNLGRRQRETCITLSSKTEQLARIVDEKPYGNS